MKADAVNAARRTGPRRGLRKVAAAVYVGVSVTAFEQLVAEGRLPKPKRQGGVTIWDRYELDIYFEAWPAEGEERRPRRADM